MLATLFTRPWGRRPFSASARQSRNPRPRRLWVESLESRLLPAVIEVTSLADSGPGSLRAAISQANGDPGSTIVFRVAGTIALGTTAQSPLPLLTARMTIDGTSAPGYVPGNPPVVVLDGTALPGPTARDGFTIFASGTSIKGLEIREFTAYGIEIQSAGQCVIESNYIHDNDYSGIGVWGGF